MSSLEINVGILGHGRIDFDRRPIRKAILKESREVRKIMRRLLARRAISVPGEYPGKTTGDVQRSISAKSKARGFVGVVEPRRTPRMNKRKFYPSILTYGVEGRIAPRQNPAVTALDMRRAAIQSALRAALEQSLVPR
jgi:hypothetical protein